MLTSESNNLFLPSVVRLLYQKLYYIPARFVRTPPQRVTVRRRGPGDSTETVDSERAPCGFAAALLLAAYCERGATAKTMTADEARHPRAKNAHPSERRGKTDWAPSACAPRTRAASSRYTRAGDRRWRWRRWWWRCPRRWKCEHPPRRRPGTRPSPHPHRRDHVSARSRYAIRAGTLVEWKNVPIDAVDDDDDAVAVRDSTPSSPPPVNATGADSSSLALARFPVTPERAFFVCTRTI